MDAHPPQVSCVVEIWSMATHFWHFLLNRNTSVQKIDHMGWLILKKIIRPQWPEHQVMQEPKFKAAPFPAPWDLTRLRSSGFPGLLGAPQRRCKWVPWGNPRGLSWNHRPRMVVLLSTFTGWWFSPSWKIWKSMGKDYPIYEMDNKNVWSHQPV